MYIPLVRDEQAGRLYLYRFCPVQIPIICHARIQIWHIKQFHKQNLLFLLWPRKFRYLYTGKLQCHRRPDSCMREIAQRISCKWKTLGFLRNTVRSGKWVAVDVYSDEYSRRFWTVILEAQYRDFTLMDTAIPGATNRIHALDILIILPDTSWTVLLLSGLQPMNISQSTGISLSPGLPEVERLIWPMRSGWKRVNSATIQYMSSFRICSK